MKALILAALSLSLSVASGTVYAQLGAKGSAHLAATDLERVKVGDRAPDFTLENLDGKTVSLSQFRGKKIVVLVFYRGHW